MVVDEATDNPFVRFTDVTFVQCMILKIRLSLFKWEKMPTSQKRNQQPPVHRGGARQLHGLGPRQESAPTISFNCRCLSL
jgi:hypothetical protein